MSDKPDDSGGFCCAMAGMHMGHDEDCANRVCPTCHDGGMVSLGEHFVSHEMAIDGGDAALEGMSMGIEWGICPDCGAHRAALAAEEKKP